MSRTIFFCGDTHGRFDHIVSAVQQHRPDAVVLLGDLQPRMPLDEALRPVQDMAELWWIHGNHDTDSDSDFDNLLESGLAGRTLHGRIATVAGARIAGLGGIFRGQVWEPPQQPRVHTQAEYAAQCGRNNLWRGGLPRKHRSTIFPVDYDALLSAGPADILVTHEAPDCHPYGFAAIRELAQLLEVKQSFHAHHHDRLDYREADAKNGFRAFGVGLRGISDQNGNVIVAGELDEQRRNRPGFAP